MLIINKYILNLISFFLIIYPFALLSGPFFSDGIVSVVSILFIFLLIYNKDYNFVTNYYNLFFLFIFIYLIFSSLISTNVILSLESSLFYSRHWIFCLSFAYVIMYNKKIFSFFLLSTIFMIVFLLLDSFIQYYTGLNLLNYEYNGYRLSSLFNDELILGSFLFRFFPIVIGLIFLFLNDFKIKIITLTLTSLVFGFIIILSGERTAIFLFLSYLLILSLLKTENRIFFLTILLFFISLFIILVSNNKNIEKRIVNYTLNQILEKKIEKNDAMYNDEIDLNFFLSKIENLKLNDLSIFSIQHEVIYRTALKIFNDNKITGIGPKNFREVCKQKKYQTFTSKDNSVNGCSTHPHNTHLQILTETGIIGYFLFILIYMKIINLIIKKDLRLGSINKNLKFLQLSCLITIFLSLFPLIPSGNIFNNYYSNLIYLPVAIYLAIELSKKTKEKNI